MRHFDEDEAKRLNAEQWQIDLLKLNPSYISWGPHEDYMWTGEDSKGWNSRQIRPTWKEFGPWALDDLNECVNFYFSIQRADQECSECNGNGYHRLAQEVVNGFYRHMNDLGTEWHDKITADEFEALKAAGRARDFKTVEECNAANAPGARNGFLMSHDAINRSILTRTRLERLGLPHTCDKCQGHGRAFTADKPTASLTLWWLHPRKGCSRGVEVTEIQQGELPEVFAYLRSAAERNAERFSRLPATV
jgi:hypothetical protein